MPPAAPAPAAAPPTEQQGEQGQQAPAANAHFCPRPCSHCVFMAQNIAADSKVKKAFGCLRRFSQYHMGVHNYAAGDEERRSADIMQARADGLTFGCIAEQMGCPSFSLLIKSLDFCGPQDTPHHHSIPFHPTRRSWASPFSRATCTTLCAA